MKKTNKSLSDISFEYAGDCVKTAAAWQDFKKEFFKIIKGILKK
jgi:hypothetical protein